VVAEMQPKFLRPGGQRDGASDRIVADHRLLKKADDIPVVDLQELQVRRLLQCAVVMPDPVEPPDVILNVAGLVPVTRFDLVFFRVDIFLPPGDRLVFEQFESVVDAVVR